MNFCLFGTYVKGEGYPVNSVLEKGLKEANGPVFECHETFWLDFIHTTFKRLSLRSLGRLGGRLGACYWRLAKRYRRLDEHQCVVVGYPGYLDVWLARLLNWRRRRLIVLVAFISLYDTVVGDRRQAAGHSLKGRLLRWVDRAAFGCADVVLVDTQAHGRYYAELFGLAPDKFVRSFVGQDEASFRPLPAGGRGDEFSVLFFGTYVPLHGIDVIVEAASLLRDEALTVTLVGSGQLYQEVQRQVRQRGLDNMRLVNRWLDTDELVQHIAAADVCLGIFGVTPKAARVIPYKVFGALAMQKPLITRDSPAVRELLEDGRHALLCRPGCAADLAASIRRLYQDPGLAAALGRAGYERFLQRATPAAIGRDLVRNLEARLG